MNEEKAKIGDYVTAKLVGENDCRQGVYFRDNSNQTITVKGEECDYICEPRARVVADIDIFGPATQQHVKKIRQQLALG